VKRALMLILETLCSGDNVLLYCRHGKHRAGVVTITIMALLANPTTVWTTALFHAKDVYFAAHPNRLEYDFEQRVRSIFETSNFDVCAGKVRHEVLQFNSKYVAFAELVYGVRPVDPRLPGLGTSSASSSSMPLGSAPSGTGAGNSSAPSGAGGEAAPGGDRTGGNYSAPRSEVRGPIYGRGDDTTRGEDRSAAGNSSRGPGSEARSPSYDGGDEAACGEDRTGGKRMPFRHR
jgi:hypothetical protein